LLPDAEYPQIPDGSPAEAWTDEIVNDITDEDVEMIAHVDEQSTLTGSDSRPADHAAPTELELEWTAVQALRTPTFWALSVGNASVAAIGTARLCVSLPSE
jgi:hypothetical protein